MARRWSPLDRRIIRKVLDGLKGRLEEISAVYLFGSRARAASGENSDLDILVVCKNRGALEDIAQQGRRFLDEEENAYLNLTILSEAAYRRDERFRRSIERDGISLLQEGVDD